MRAGRAALPRRDRRRSCRRPMRASAWRIAGCARTICAAPSRRSTRPSEPNRAIPSSKPISVCWRWPQDDAPRAIRLLQSALSRDPGFLEARFNLARALRAALAAVPRRSRKPRRFWRSCRPARRSAPRSTRLVQALQIAIRPSVRHSIHQGRTVCRFAKSHIKPYKSIISAQVPELDTNAGSLLKSLGFTDLTFVLPFHLEDRMRKVRIAAHSARPDGATSRPALSRSRPRAISPDECSTRRALPCRARRSRPRTRPPASPARRSATRRASIDWRACRSATTTCASSCSGFTTVEQKGIVVNVGQTLSMDATLKVASVAETITVTGESPLIEATASSVGGVVDIGRIESLPLNGRQFANLAATIPGVGLGFHSDPTKSTQYSPQINGGNGRNVNYQIDGGDNNDDTVGGLLQLFPLEAIQEFNLITSRSKAEYGRSNGGVMNIVTKSGTNVPGGSVLHDVPRHGDEREDRDRKGQRRPKSRTTGATSSAARSAGRSAGQGAFLLCRRAHAADTFQLVEHRGAVPESRWHLRDAVPRESAHRQGDGERDARRSTCRCATAATRTQPYGASPQTPPNGWGTSENSFNSINLNHNWVLGGSKLNEFIFQYADFRNHIGANSTDPYELFPNGVSVGQSPNTPQTTEQKKWQFRDDFSWSVTGHGRPRPRLQGRRQLHQRAAPVHHVQLRQGRAAAHPPHRRSQRADLDGDAERRRRVGEHSAEAVRDLLPGRLARHRSADDQRRSALRPDHGLPVRSVAQPELHQDAGGGSRRTAQRHQGSRERRARPQGRHQQHPAAHRLCLRRQRQRPHGRPRRLGHLHGHGLHQFERAVRRE